MKNTNKHLQKFKVKKSKINSKINKLEAILEEENKL